jgi:hypothetical protein
MYMYMYMYIYIHTHTHTHTYKIPYFTHLCNAYTNTHRPPLSLTQVLGECKPFSLTGSLPLVKELQTEGYDLQIIGYGLMKCYHARNETGLLSDFTHGFQVLLRAHPPTRVPTPSNAHTHTFSCTRAHTNTRTLHTQSDLMFVCVCR